MYNLEELNPMTLARTNKQLNKQYYFNIDGKRIIQTVEEHIDHMASTGVLTKLGTTKEANYDRIKFNRMLEPEQIEYMARLKNGREYFVKDCNGGMLNIPKLIYNVLDVEIDANSMGAR